MSASFEVLVVGAGPAGALTARRLGTLGVRVGLVVAATRPGWEGLSARSRTLLAEEDIDLDSLGCGAALERRVRWAMRSVQGIEWVADRVQLAAAARLGAGRAGATLIEGRVRRAHRDTSEPLWHLELHGGERLSARLLIEARGRRGAGAVRLIATGQHFTGVDRALEGSFVAPFSEGWCWWACRRGEAHLQLVATPRREPPAQSLARAARELPAVAALIEHAQAAGRATRCAAQAQLGSMLERGLAVGDAALALDPLSGQAVFEAVGGARVLASAVAAVLAGSELELAQRFVRARYEERWRQTLRVARDLYGENAPLGPFWQRIARDYSAASLPACSRARFEPRPVLAGARIIERPVLVTPAHPRGLWQVAGVELAQLQGLLERDGALSISGAAAALEASSAAVARAYSLLVRSGMLKEAAYRSAAQGG